MPSVALNDIDHMREAVFFDGPDVETQAQPVLDPADPRLGDRAAGVVADSTATVSAP